MIGHGPVYAGGKIVQGRFDVIKARKLRHDAPHIRGMLHSTQFMSCDPGLPDRRTGQQRAASSF
jgi:hypothetical protein